MDSIGAVYKGKVYHMRFQPVTHRFNYNLPFFIINISKAKEINHTLRLLSVNPIRSTKKSLLTLESKDYLTGGDSLEERFLSYIAKKKYANNVKTIFLVTNPRYLGLIFNPVSFFIAYDDEGKLLCVLVNVNNTFHEKHMYLLDETNIIRGKASIYEHKKEFHVSPFNDMQGKYRFEFKNIDTIKGLLNAFSVTITLYKETKYLVAGLNGQGHMLNDRNIIKVLGVQPYEALLNFPRILYEAYNLKFRKGVDVYMKPVAQSNKTYTRKKKSVFQNIMEQQIMGLLEKFKEGNLTVIFPDGRVKEFGDLWDSRKVRLRILDYRFYNLIISNGDIGFGEAYMKGYFKTDNLTLLLELFIINRDYTHEKAFTQKAKGKLIDRFRHRGRSNTLIMSRKNIQAHYDLSNEFFEMFLDKTMSYSSGIFESVDMSLSDSQLNKIDKLLESISISSEDHLLEIGSGWGKLAIRAAKKYGCRVTTVTLSKEQYKYVKKRLDDEGLNHQVEIFLKDYREIEGQYDKIVSVEMLEAVGYENYGQYFTTIEKLLKPGASAAIQVITIQNELFDSYRENVDWIQKYIFPGGLVASEDAIRKAVNKETSLNLNGFRRYGFHYAETLRRWRNKFLRNKESIRGLGFDATFMRMWNYYLCYCEAGFNQEKLNLVHFNLRKDGLDD